MINFDSLKGKDITKIRDCVGMPKKIQRTIDVIRAAYFDGRNSALLDHPFHENWKECKHFNPSYEIGYWLGYDDGIQKEFQAHWPQINEG